MSMNPEALGQALETVSKVLLEISLAQVRSADALIPIYSLLGDLEHQVTDDDVVRPVVRSGLQSLDPLLENAGNLSGEDLANLTSLVQWVQSALEARKQGLVPDPFAATPEQIASVEAAFAGLTPAAAVSLAMPQLQSLASPAAPPPGPAEELLRIGLEEDREVLSEFHTEALDHLEQIEASLLVLEKNPEDPEHLNAVFRSFHTIKGVSGFLQLIPIQSLAHEVESILDQVRTHKLKLSSSLITLFLQSRDRIQTLVDQVTVALRDGTLPTAIVPIQPLIAQLKVCAAGGDLPVARVPARAKVEDPLPNEVPLPGMGQPAATPQPEPAPAAASAPRAGGGNAEGEGGKGQNGTIRVNTLKLDSLMDLVGELVIVQSQLRESAQATVGDNSPQQRNLSQLTRITKELQHISMSLRMVPIKPTFQKMGRLARDLARDFGKEVTFHTVGEETELDRNMVEQLNDPLVHMMRNAIDHGLEGPEERRGKGKAGVGNLWLSAYHIGGSIVVELRDDGRGLNRDRILAKAREKGLVAPDAELTDAEIYQLIFLPGFSTAEKISNVSGRGVGMDVVRRNIENLRGSVELDSRLGEGTTFKVKLPLTMAIIDGLLVRVGEEKFILPALAVKRAVRPEAKQVARLQNRLDVIDLRGKTLPVLSLCDHFHIETPVHKLTDGIVVVVESFGTSFGLLVDELISKQEVVIKNLGALMQQAHGIAGGAILGDGTIALILDPGSLWERRG